MIPDHIVVQLNQLTYERDRNAMERTRAENERDRLRTENKLLRAVADAAKSFLEVEGEKSTPTKWRSTQPLIEALAALDRAEKGRGDG